MIDSRFLTDAGCTPKQISAIMYARELELNFLTSCSTAGLHPKIARRVLETEDLQTTASLNTDQQAEIIRATWPEFIKP